MDGPSWIFPKHRTKTRKLSFHPFRVLTPLAATFRPDWLFSASGLLPNHRKVTFLIELFTKKKVREHF